LFSCNDYLDVNTDPSHLTFDKITPAKLLPAAQVGSYAVQNTTMNQLGNVFSNAWGANVQQYTGGYAKEMQLTVDNAFYNTIWDNLYLNINNFQQIINYPNADHANDNYVAAAKICKAYYMQYIVDLYGDAPYTDAFKGGSVVTPKYNDDQYIYRQLLSELDDARALIDAADPAALDISSTDVMLLGVMSEWKKFANTIELKMLLRMSNSTGAVKTFRDSRLSSLIANNFDFIISDVRINPGYSDSNDLQLNPFYVTFLASAAGQPTQNYSFIAATGHYYKSLSAFSQYPTGASHEIIPGSGVNYSGVPDPRRLRIFRNGASQAVFRGVTQGSTVVDVYPPSGTAGVPGRVGLGCYNPYSQVSSPTSVLDFYGVDGYVMTVSEADFLIAEAALRWPAFAAALGDDGSLMFNDGIDKSMSFRTASGGAAYIAAINSVPKFGWTGSDDDKLHAIMYQKWVALIGVNGIESYIDNTRTGYPLTPLATSAQQTRKPRRLIYPISEYIANSSNVPNITPANIFAATDPSQPFWLLGDPALGN